MKKKKRAPLSGSTSRGADLSMDLPPRDTHSWTDLEEGEISEDAVSGFCVTICDRYSILFIKYLWNFCNIFVTSSLS